MDGRLDDDKTRSKQPVITEPHSYRPSDESCMVGGACGGCAKGKYSQITGEEGMISATMDIRGGIRKEWFSILIFQGKVYFDFHFKWN